MMEYYRAAVVVRPHGVRGALKLLPLTNDINRFKGLRQVYIEQKGERKAAQINEISIMPDSLIMGLEGVATREEAEALRGAYICVDRAHAVALPSDTWFVADLIGCQTFDTNGVAYGRVVDVLQTGANDVYELDSGVLVPALKKVLQSVDVEQKRIVFVSDVLKEVAVFAD